ncbi:hypothetical protein BS50DRAFT_274149 [Corynespora cassiicola Philippines]|uniref:Uncharacterized protein n=1 Tax=Corynespora cassiicola Philippines TaxID=1448308 RepID=A0A2T2P0D2_CORCC|nr:hypothetical protein BS50DRAFT_274149 [Corynespora cassiicola Philippines]
MGIDQIAFHVGKFWALLLLLLFFYSFPSFCMASIIACWNFTLSLIVVSMSSSLLSSKSPFLVSRALDTR